MVFAPIDRTGSDLPLTGCKKTWGNPMFSSEDAFLVNSTAVSETSTPESVGAPASLCHGRNISLQTDVNLTHLPKV